MVGERLRGYLKDPFLSRRVPSYLTDTTLPGLRVLTAGSRSCDPLGQRLLRPFGSVLDRLDLIFDFVLLDAPPVTQLSPATTLAALTDGVLLVVKAEGSEVARIRRAVDDLRRAKGNVLGVVLNRVDIADAGLPQPDLEAVLEERR